MKFRFSAAAPDDERRQCEDDVRGLAADIDTIRFVRIARSVDEPDVSGLLMGFDDANGFASYQVHPAHLPVAARIDGLCSEVVRFDIVTEDDPAAFR